MTISAEECTQIGEDMTVYYPSFVKAGDNYKVKMYFGNTTIKIVREFKNSENGEIVRRECPVDYSFDECYVYSDVLN